MVQNIGSLCGSVKDIGTRDVIKLKKGIFCKYMQKVLFCAEILIKSDIIEY